MAFDLSSVSKSTGIGAPRILVYGTAGVGKTTFAAQAEGKAIELAEQQRRAKRERKAERRRRREERQQRAERQPGTYM